jgi:hypothetical protein
MQSLRLDVIRYLNNAERLYLQNDSMSIRTFSLSTWSSTSTDFLTNLAITGHVGAQPLLSFVARACSNAYREGNRIPGPVLADLSALAMKLHMALTWSVMLRHGQYFYFITWDDRMTDDLKSIWQEAIMA